MKTPNQKHEEPQKDTRSISARLNDLQLQTTANAEKTKKLAEANAALEKEVASLKAKIGE